MMSISRKIQILSAAVAFAVLALPAAAQGYYAAAPQQGTYPPQPVRAAQGPNNYVNDPSIPYWAGPYVGGHVGGVWSDFTNSTPTAGPSGSASSFTGGGQIGFLWQSNKLVYGVEGDASWLNLSSNTPGAHFHEGYTLTARGRLGYAVGPWLPYITGGAAFTNTRFENAAGASTENFEPGFTAGAGLEKYMSPHWSARAEYLYVDVPKETETVGGTTIAGGSGNSTARLALNYHF